MKKLIFAIATAATLFANAEMINIVEKTKDGKVVTNRIDAVEYAHVYAEKHRKAWMHIEHKFIRMTNAEAIAQCDDILSASKVYTLYSMVKYPKCGANGDKMLCEIYPAAQNFIKYDHDKTYYCIARMIYALVNNKSLDTRLINSVINVSEKSIKRQLRKEGKTFVEKDGVNPVQDRVNMLTKAFNAKRLAGLNSAMRACGIDYGIDFESMLLPESEITDMCNKIFIGEIGFSDINQRKLRTHLGVEEYNAFVKRYNEND